MKQPKISPSFKKKTYLYQRPGAIVPVTALLALLGGCGTMASCSPCRPRMQQYSATPCAAKRGSNPCAAKNPCAMRNPCAVTNPCAMDKRGPCSPGGAVNPCAVKRPPGYRPMRGDVALGQRLFNDTSLSTNGMSCNSCHGGDKMYLPTFKQPYPHRVAMAKEQFGQDTTYLDEMVQICMVAPMQSKPLDWNGKELAALTAYMAEVQKRYRANPCAGKNPCAVKNPCAIKNPCAVKNPCAAW